MPNIESNNREVCTLQTDNQSFSTELTGLNSNTTYYVRAYAINDKGVGYGEVYSFETPMYTPDVTVVTGDPRYIGFYSAILAGYVMYGTDIKEGGLIFGGSAGAIIFGTTIETVAEERENYPDNLSISYVKKYAIRCHYQKEEDNLYQNLSKSLKQDILAIPEDGGIIIDKDDIKKIIGDVILFSANQKQILWLNNAEI